MNETIKVSHSKMSALFACEEYYRQNYLIEATDEEYQPVDGYWANLGSGIQYILEKIANTNFNDFDLHQDIINQEIDHLSYCMVDIDKFDENIHLRNINFPDATLLTDYEYYPIDLQKHKVAKMQTMRNRWCKLLKEYYPTLAYTMIDRWGLENIQSEVEIKSSSNGVSFRGSADFLCKLSDGSYELVDGKLRYNPEYLDPMQLIGYAYHLEEIGYNISKLTWWDYTENKFINVPFSDVDMARYNDKVTKYIQTVQSFDNEHIYKRSPNYLCRYCPLDESECSLAVDEI